MEERIRFADILAEVESSREVSRLNWMGLMRLFGDRFLRAWRLVSEGRVKRYVFRPSGRELWVVVGQGGEYIVFPRADYCSCSSFYFRVIDGKEGYCYHLLAHKLSLALNHYLTVLEEDEFYWALMDVWLEEMRNIR